jgi:hypothetical protein
MRIIKAIIAIIIILYSCNNSQSNYLNNLCANNPTFHVDSSRQSLSYPINENNKYLSLKEITYPSDTFIFRVYYNTDKTTKIFEYSYFISIESYKTYEFPFDLKSGKILYDKTKDTLTSFEKVFQSPANGKGLIPQLEKNNILELRDCSDIPGYPKVEYSKSFVIEYSNKCRYGIVSYNDPFKFAKNFQEAASVANLLSYLKIRFKF